MPHTFFIYNGRGSSPESVKDLEVLCGSVQERSNIYCTDFLNSPDGLSSSSIIVIPGGSAMTISFGIGRSRWDVTDMVKTKGYGYFGVCAGAYIATNEGYFYNHIKTPECPTVFLKTQGELSLNLGDYAITHGPFLPDEHAITMGNYNAHFASTSSEILPTQLYVSGCGFTSIDTSVVDVLGVYTGKPNYRFSTNGVVSTYTQMGFAIRKPAREHTSAILLSGTHLEAAIPNSSLLSKVDTDAPTIRQRYAMFQEQRPHIFDNTVKLLNETFK